MTKTMLIDAANSEEIRVCLLQNGKVEDFDFESASRKPVRGNIYLARVTRVEPSLQAAFVEFGGNRHGFLAFNEIHPDYYQIPVSDRRVLQEAEIEEAAIAAALNGSEGADDDDRDLDEIAADIGGDIGANGSHRDRDEKSSADGASDNANGEEPADDATGAVAAAADPSDKIAIDAPEPSDDQADDHSDHDDHAHEHDAAEHESADHDDGDHDHDDHDHHAHEDDDHAPAFDEPAVAAGDDEDSSDDEIASEDDSGGDEEEAKPARERTPLEIELAALTRPQLIERYREARRKRARLVRNYKIQEVVKRRQILLVQAVKEERGNKGAALTTYLSLAGRYCVLMPNTARGGGISRKIPVAADRKRLRRIVDSLDVSGGMGLIIRTAGAKRTKAEIKRDYEYLVRLWENIRTLTLKSIAPCLIYEEASLIKRAIRDLYDKDIDSVTVEGDAGYREAKDFMKMLMPSHAKNVQPYKEKTPLFLKHGVETQLDAMYRPTVRLKSGGYIVINQTEALIAIDVNSGKSTRERNIEQTALRTNLEAADEIARQCRLRDLAGLIVIDFIDMEEGRNNRSVEKRLKDALRFDRARIQLGRISGFGLLELSRQRRRSGIIDGTTHMCPTCGGAGAVRSHEMAALRILRGAENEAISSKAGNLQIKAALDVTLYILNHKRDWLARIETDYGVKVELLADPAKAGDNFEIEKTGQRIETAAAPVIVRADTTETILADEEEPAEEIAADAEDASDESGDQQDGDQSGKRKRRRRRRGGRRDQQAERSDAPPGNDEAESADEDEETSASESGAEARNDGEAEAGSEGTDQAKKRRRRGRRGGRRARRDDTAGEGSGTVETSAASDADQAPGSKGDDAGQIEPSETTIAAEEKTSEKVAAPKSARSSDAGQDIAASHQDADAKPSAPVMPAPVKASATPAPETPTEDYAEPPKPTRKGWWNRAMGG